MKKFIIILSLLFTGAINAQNITVVQFNAKWNSHNTNDNIEKVKRARKLVKSNILLKGPNTVILSYDKKIVVNYHSSPELAVIGSGDVLSGLIVSLMGKKKMNPFMAACAAAWLHGDIAKKHGKGLIAEDIVKGIPQALKRLKNGKFIR